MPLPTKIQSTFRRTSIVESQNPAIFNSSATKLNNVGAFNDNASLSTLQIYIQNYRSSLSTAARLLNLRNDIGFLSFTEEFDRFVLENNGLPKYYKKLNDCYILREEALKYRNLIINIVQQIAQKNPVELKNQINQSTIDAPFKVQLLDIVKQVSISTAVVS